MIIDIDIGNSQAKWRIAGSCAVEMQSTQSLQEGWRCSASGVDRVRVACVARVEALRAITEHAQHWWGIDCEIAQVKSGIAGVTPCYTDLSRLGVDRWLAMLSAYQMTGQSCAVVSAGSAITADWLNDRGEHLGGFIVPGRKLLASTLLKDLANVLQQPLAVSQANLGLGKSSEECGANGISVMLAGFINDIARRSQNAPIFLAGGDAKILYELCDEVEKWRLTLVVNPVLDGLAIAMP